MELTRGLCLSLYPQEAAVITTPNGETIKIVLVANEGKRTKLLFCGDRKQFCVRLGKNYSHEEAMAILKRENS